MKDDENKSAPHESVLGVGRYGKTVVPPGWKDIGPRGRPIGADEDDARAWEQAVEKRLAALEERAVRGPGASRLGRRALVALIWADLALVLWWAAMTARTGLSPLPGAVVCAFAVLAAIALLAQTRAEASWSDRTRRGAGAERRTR